MLNPPDNLVVNKNNSDILRKVKLKQMYMKPILSMTLLIFLLFSCGSKIEKEQAQPPKKLTMITIPAALNTPDDRAAYLVMHYWDNFDFADTSYINRPEITEQALVDYIDIFQHVPDQTASESISSVLNKAQTNQAMYSYFTSLFEKYLYDPESPFRNEEYYIPVLENIIASDNVTADNKVRPRFQLKLAQKNRVRTQATDFRFALSSGQERRLSDLSSDYLLLMFYDPECANCKETKEQIKASPVIAQLTGSGQLDILAIYADEDIENWKKHSTDIPGTWINGYDKAQVIKEQQLYDLRAMPTLYLLDRNKTIIRKDAPFENIEQYLSAQALQVE